MKNYRIYIEQKSWELFTVANTENEACFLLERFDEREVHSIIVEHDTDTKADNPCTHKLRIKNLNKK